MNSPLSPVGFQYSDRSNDSLPDFSNTLTEQAAARTQTVSDASSDHSYRGGNPGGWRGQPGPIFRPHYPVYNRYYPPFYIPRPRWDWSFFVQCPPFYFRWGRRW